MARVTGRERFLAEMVQVVPWAQILALIEPYDPKAGNPQKPAEMAAPEALSAHPRPTIMLIRSDF